MPSNTPMTAAQLLALADRIASAAFHDGYFAHEIDDNNICAIQAAAEAYRAARAASPRTLEEVLMIRSCRAYNDYIFARDLPGNGDPDELLAKYNAAHRAQAEYACTLSVAAYESEEHTRRLAGEGGGA